LHEAGETLVDLFWAGASASGAPVTLGELPATTPESLMLSKQLRRRGFVFVGPTTAYAAMQACGVVNDHLTNCPVRDAVAAQRQQALEQLAA
jgi:DNA-3-methyladenine glycosylase I